MRRARTLRWIGPLILLASGAGASGCIHNHYYGPYPACTEAPAGAVVASEGAVCEVPPAGSSGVVISQTPSRTTILGGPPSRVVIHSEPMGVRTPTRSASRFAWLRPEAETLTRTRTEGGLDDEAVIR
ncbi:MAG: hypothetical protein IRY99_27100 [Isosphaeraceae bacterium]|nr:hypothetical protein [Isosphaeraceae bacterium]